jgi:hypothetical protein
MEELKSISEKFTIFTWITLGIGVVCSVCSIFCWLGDNNEEFSVLLTIGVSSLVSSGILKFSRILIDALNHIVTAARKYTNE